MYRSQGGPASFHYPAGPHHYRFVGAPIVRIIREVQSESITVRSNEPRQGYLPEPVDMSEYDGMTEDETWAALLEKAYAKCGGR
ncbi:hypothetical protein EKD02_02530 [Chlorobium phaeovibrioides]|uniref:Uncharacterized protein n=1 Tax=Chlorobium phaeovibrioides TaxID=1094 RepID=A0A3S0L2V0_CHLPH|nr:hypothetical protein [Chlorobium phaeovibrioides]RTY39569.1 hypothetical protein EKD02_02530 [Chlorobium phaeovibrioides]